MKTLIIAILMFVGLQLNASPIDSVSAPMRPKLEAEKMRLKEERKFGRRHLSKPMIRVIHITLFISTSLMLWYESRDDYRR